MTVRILTGDCRDVLKTLPDESVHCVVTSPPYWGLRDYGVDGQIGREESPDAFVAGMVEVFQEVRRVLRDDGTAWVNLGDTFQNAKGQAGGVDPKQPARRHRLRPNDVSIPGLKPKDLIGIPWMVAFALRADGWWLRRDIIWSKPNPMPESVVDRPTSAHEYVFLLSKSKRYFYDAEAIKEPAIYFGLANQDESGFKNPQSFDGKHKAGYRSSGPKGNAKTFRGGSYVGGQPGPREVAGNTPNESGMRNARSVWEIATAPFSEAHFATFPPALAERCIKAGCPVGGTVLDPFGGAGTVGLVADRLQRDAILIELNPEYAAMAERRIRGDAPMFAQVSQ